MARQNKSNELAEMLRYQITSGQLQANEQLEAIARLAKRHSTTIATVSKALASLEQAGYVERIPNKGVYVKEKQNRLLALVMDSNFSYDPTSVSSLPILLKELERKCREENWGYELFFSVNDSASAQNFLLRLSQNAFDAVLICSRWLAENSADIFKSKSAFTIGIYPYNDLDFSISFDVYKMVYDAVQELDRLGCQQIALIDNNQDQSWSKNEGLNFKGYCDGLKSVGQLRNSRLYLKVPISQQGGHNAFCELLKSSKSRPLGIVSVDSMITLGIIQAALSRKFKIPEDIVIASHVNQGCGAAQFTVPIIKYEYPINAHLDRIAKFIKLYNAGQNTPAGVDLMPPVKKVFFSNEMLLTANFA